MFPLPQVGDVAKTETERPAAVAADAGKDSEPAKALPATPDAKIKTDAELAADSKSTPGNPSLTVESVTPGNPPVVATPVRPVSRRGEVSDQEKREWYTLVAVSSGAAVFDAWSTRRAVSGGFGTEANPLLKPFAHSNAMYAATQISPLVMDFVARKMMTSRNNLIRKMWWLPQVAGTNVSVSSAIHNVSIVH
jgi:hypothetical protein